ncbi:MAG: hypothetical protein P1P88_24145 [Bacteroidales bacterium]|nr:hypothetical protein [Bacteroidales bacterium]
MKKLIVFLLATLMIYSCDSPKKALQRGSYEQACILAIKKLQKKPADVENAEIFTVAYQKANQADMDRIEYLKLSGEQTSWDEIHKLYTKLDRRQKLAETILPLRAGGKTVNFEHINYNEKIIEAKNSAADFHYNKGLDLLNGTKDEARLAFNHLEQARSYSSNYPDIEQKIKEAKEKGTTTVFVSSLNKTYAQLSPEFMGNLVDFGMNELDDNWTRYFNSPVKQQFDYNIFISITSIYVSPNDIKESKEIVKKEVRDGWEYEYDAKGNVKKDSVGNDLKKPKYKTISCTVTSKIQKKFSTLKAAVEIQDNNTQRIVGSTPIEAKYEFEFISAFANGDLNALDEETKKTIGQTPVSFPADIDMINYAGDDLKIKIIAAIKRNKNLIK